MSTTVNHPSLPQFPTRRELLNWLESNNEDVPEVFNLGNDGSRDEPTDPPDLLISYFRANFSFFPSVRANHWREYTFAGDRVVAGAPLRGRELPFRLHPALHLHHLECRVERAFLHAQHVVGESLDVLRDRVPVHGVDGQRLEHQHCERAWQELGARRQNGHTLATYG